MILLAAAAWAATRITASLTVQVDDRDAAEKTVVAAAKADGGWFTQLSESAVTVRVPVDKARPFVDRAQALGRVADRSWSATSLDEQTTLLEARLAARQDVLQRYLAVLADAQSESVVTVSSEINRTIAEIEGLQGQLRLLRHQGDYAQVTVAFQYVDRAAPRRDGTSSFAWLNTLNVADLQADFRAGTFTHRTAGVHATAPDGFAAWKKTSRYAATSPDGLVYRVRRVRNKPAADLAFWTEALRTRQKEAGYTLLAEGPTKAASGQAGAWLELGAADGAVDDTYLVVLYVDGRNLVLVEAAGEASHFAKRRDAVLAAAAAVTF